MPTTLSKKKAPAVKFSITIRSDLAKRISDVKNRSEIFNAALSEYLKKQEYLEAAEEAYWRKGIEAGLDDLRHWRVVKIGPWNRPATWEEFESALNDHGHAA